MEESTYSLPSPVDTPYNRTPSSSRSSRSRQEDEMSVSTTPPPLPEDGRAVKRRSRDSDNPALDENIPLSDPRRFTPTLHASLVSEILSLRRDLENRTKDIERLELGLHSAQTHNERLNSDLQASNKEARLAKRQLQQIESGTVSAINDVTKERDEATNEITELCLRLDQSQKRVKVYEDETERAQNQWDKEKESWQNEKRTLETKVHIVEGRLKAVLDEVANTHVVNGGLSQYEQFPRRRTSYGSPSKSPMRSTRSRRYSANSDASDGHGGRQSVLSHVNGVSINLADELAFDEAEEDQLGLGADDGRVSPDALPEERERPMSSLSVKARKILGLPFSLQDDSINVAKAGYVDTGVQFSPPTTPGLQSAFSISEYLTRESPEPGRARYSKELVTPITPAEDDETGAWTSHAAPSKPVMVSSSCQTIEALPSPPLTPQKVEMPLATVSESRLERVAVVTVGTQTEHGNGEIDYTRRSTDGPKLQIPVITIIPPGSRPATPETHVVLPPRTKNASCQADLKPNYTTSTMQTEEIRVDKRYVVPPPVSASSMFSSFRPLSSARPPAVLTGRPKPQRAPASAPGPTAKRAPPMKENGTITKDFALGLPARTSSLFAGFDDDVDEKNQKFMDEAFNEEDIFNRPITKYTLRSGKLVNGSEQRDSGEKAAANAGEAAALQTLRLSEDSLPPDLKSISGRQSPPKKSLTGSVSANRGLKRVPSSKSSNMRRAALISSGVATHKATNSQSTTASDMMGPPPLPIPLRYSSARIPKSLSEGGRSSRASSNTSPTKKPKSKFRPNLRKTRSAAAVAHSPQRGARSRSPPLDPRVSIVPEMPSFAMPESKTPSFLETDYYDQIQPEASAPRPSVATGPNRKGSHVKTNSDVNALHQTSVVDSIAQTMVGEWMFKYVRRRKSFGIGDKRQDDWDPNKSVDELSTQMTSTGVRHKRWVWVAPYERAIMWSSKQPMSNNALLGKSGRKLIIKSVLDVKDENPMPKGSITGSHFNRSILILTPERALKFTALTQERHYVWLTALSFLSHSPLSFGDLDALPMPPDTQGSHEPTPSLAGSLRRRPIRDSIRIAKGSSRAGPGVRSFTTDGSLPVQDPSRPPTREYYDPTLDPALPPTIKRYHSRKRSNTAPRAPPSSFRMFSERGTVPALPGAGSTYSQSVVTTAGGSSDRGVYTPSLGVPSMVSSRRGSEASAAGRPNLHNMFSDSSHNSTMRMDAFIDTRGRPNLAGRYEVRRKDPTYWGMEEGRDSISPVESFMHRESTETELFRGF